MNCNVTQRINSSQKTAVWSKFQTAVLIAEIFSEKNKINEIHGNLLFPRERHHDAKSVIIVCIKLAVMD